ncbi:uncharacterized protein LOC141637218 [Silene latifolia]|uniref:uncharacterized protein LOC141637218 n=1 Tax=Silene latifolia TaxID=37657 RepID=UPI003D777B11
MSHTTNSFSLRSLLEKEKLNGSNFLEWYRNLRIVLKQEKKVYVLEKELPKKPDSNVHTTARNAWKEHSDANIDVCCLILATMNTELQKQYENVESAYDIVENLKAMFQEQARTERYNNVKAIFDCKMGKDEPVSPHVIKMIGYFDNLERLDAGISQLLATDIVFQSLNPSYNDFILNYNMNNLDKSLKELHGMLKTAEPSIKKAPTSNVLMIQKGKGFKKQGSDKEGKSKANIAKLKPKPKLVKGKPSDDVYHYCNKKGHWKRNCKKYLEEVKNGSLASTSGIYVIEELKGSRSLANGEVDLRVGNGARVAVVAVRTFHLSLPSDLVLEVDNCYHNEVQNQLGKTIKALRSDRGGEYMSQEFGDHLRGCGIVSQLTPPRTPQWNGVSERRNRSFLDMVRSVMSHASLPILFWGYALETSSFTLNRCSSKSVEKTPYEIWTGNVPKMSFLKIWSCETFARKLIPEKLCTKSDKCFFV